MGGRRDRFETAGRQSIALSIAGFELSSAAAAAAAATVVGNASQSIQRTAVHGESTAHYVLPDTRPGRRRFTPGRPLLLAVLVIDRSILHADRL